MEESGLARWPDEKSFILQHVDSQMNVQYIAFLRKRLHQDAPWKKRQAGKDGVVLWAVLCWETLTPGIHVDVSLASTTYLNNVPDKVHHIMATVFPIGRGLFQQDNAFC